MALEPFLWTGKITLAPWLVIPPLPDIAHQFSAFFIHIPFWLVIIAAVIINTVRHRWWMVLPSILLPALGYFANLWPLISEQIGWGLALWLVIFSLTHLLCRYLILSDRLLKLAARHGFRWPLYVALLTPMLVTPGWISASLSVLIALLPYFLSQRLHIFAQIPQAPLLQAQRLGANRWQRMQWLAPHWLAPKLNRWRAQTLQTTLIYCLWAGLIGLPGIGESLWNAFMTQQWTLFGQAIISLAILQLFIACMTYSSRSR